MLSLQQVGNVSHGLEFARSSPRLPYPGPTRDTVHI